MSSGHLSVYGLRRALLAGIQRVVAQRDEINRINIFPLADRDTGTNLAFTLGSVLQGVRVPCFASAGDVLGRVAADALDGARGNAGVILAHFFQGVADGAVPGRRLTLADLAAAAARGAARARTAMAEPCEGTILSVMQAFADALRDDPGGPDVRTGFLRALERAREALRRTPEQLPVLRSAGVVDAGALGFVHLLEGMAGYVARGREGVNADLPEEFFAAGIDAEPGSAEAADHHFCAQCVVGAGAVDRAALKAALLALPVSRLVLSGSRDCVRLHAHVADPARLFAAAARFGAVSRVRTVDLRGAPPAAPLAIVTDTGADLPPEALERLDVHLVPQRISIGGRDFVDGVSLSLQELYREMRTGSAAPRTSQPPPGDFRRLFEFLLAHHERVIDVSLSRALSGTLQSAAGAAARAGAARIDIFDSGHVAASLGLLVIWAAEAAAAGLPASRILEGLARMRPRTAFYAVARDIRYGVRGGRAPRIALPLTHLLHLSLLFRNRPNGRLGLFGAVWGGNRLPERFARRVARRLDPSRRYRLIVGHCDCAADAERVRATLLASGRQVDRSWVVESGAVIGAHAGPGALVVGVQDYEPPRR